MATVLEAGCFNFETTTRGLARSTHIGQLRLFTALRNGHVFTRVGAGILGYRSHLAAEAQADKTVERRALLSNVASMGSTALVKRWADEDGPSRRQNSVRRS